MESEIPKQYMMFNGKSLLRHTLDVFADIDGLAHICLVVNPQDETYYQSALMGFSLNGKENSEAVLTCAGGKTRQQSVHSGLAALNEHTTMKDDDVVLIHDAARPFVERKDIDALLSVMGEHKGASLASKAIDTFRSVNEANIAQEEVSRDKLWSLHTPQAFHYSLIKEAHAAKSDPKKVYTDDTALVSDIGCDVVLVPGSKYNFKITTQEDIHMAERILSTSTAHVNRTGMGYDVHAFDKDDIDVKSIRLCGIDIKHDHSLIGHSDADVGLHALCDAIYGAIGEGDIGLHFPPSNKELKNMDSAVFLEHAMSLLRAKEGKLTNIDVTIICESPKIGEHRAKITARLAEIIGIAPSQVNIKATTTENLGFTGRKEGIAAQAIATVSLPKDK